MAKVVIRMVFGQKNDERFEKAKANLSKITFSMYFPQMVLLTVAFVLGVYIPKFLDIMIRTTIMG